MYQAQGFAQLLRFRRTGRKGELALIVSRNVLFLGLTSLVTDVSSEMISAVLPLYVVYSLDLSPVHLGVIDGLYQGVAALVRVAAGVVADRLRRLKEVAGIGYGLSALCKLGLLVAGGSAPLLAALVVLDRTGKGIRTAPRDALLSLSAPEGGLATAFGVHRALDTAGAMLGPLVAFGLLALVPGAFDVIFTVSFCIGVVGVALFALFVEGRVPLPPGACPLSPSPFPPISGERGGLPGSTVPLPLSPEIGGKGAGGIGGRLLRLPRFRTLLLVGAALQAGAVSDGLVFVVLQRRAQFDARYLPLLYVVSALVYMLLAVPAGRLADRVGRERVFVAGYALLAGLYALLLVAHPGWPTVLGCVSLLGASYASTDGVLMALASPMLPAEVRTSGLAVLTTCTTVARLLASVLFGAVWTYWGVDRAVLLFLAGLVVVTAASGLGWVRRRGRSRVTQPERLTRESSPRRRVVLFLVIAGAMMAVAVAAVARAWLRRPASSGPAPADLATLTRKPHLLFRSVEITPPEAFGKVALSPLDPGAAPRQLTPLVCTRLYFAAGQGLCMAMNEADGKKSLLRAFGADLKARWSAELGGLPSRARVSPDGRYGAVTIFVTGHSYSDAAMSTQTLILDMVKGNIAGDLEKFEVSRDGARFAAPDMNLWGVTFARDANRFYATLSSGGKTWLVEGDVASQKLRTLRENVECPSMSPDGKRLGFKKRMGGPGAWRLSVLDLATLEDRQLAGEERPIDDQVEWVDDGNIVYKHGPDVWILPVDGSAPPRVFLPRAASPVVVRPPS